MGQGNMNLGIFTNNIDNRLFGHTVEWKVKKKKSDRTVEKHKKKRISKLHCTAICEDIYM